ncbi:MAG: TRAP transporter small permease [Peptococcaceae bacterium]
MKIIKWCLQNIEELFSSMLLCIVVSMLFIQVFSRYVLGHSLSWSEELLRYSFLAMVYFASAMGAKYGKHFRVTVLVNLLPVSVRKFFDLLQYEVWLVFNGFVIYYSVVVIQGMGTRPQISQVLGWDMRYIYAIIPVAFAFQTFRLLQRAVMEFRSVNKTEMAGGE